MKIISHRANLFGPDFKRENNPSAIKECLDMGYDVEIDIWFKDNNYYLGHDTPKTYISKDFLLNENLWCHAKNLSALENMLRDKIHCFWHQDDDYTLTSKNVIWTYPGKKLTKNSVIVSNVYPEEICLGICTDYPVKIKNEKNS